MIILDVKCWCCNSRTAYHLDFKSKNQLPWIMYVREEIDEYGDTEYAAVIWSFWPTYSIKRWLKVGI